jgi:YggT family protein
MGLSMVAPLIVSILFIFNTLVEVYEVVVILAVVVSWLIPMGVMSMRNDIVRQLVNMLDALTEPVFRSIRRVVPPVAGIDFSPFIVLIALQVIKYLVNAYAVMLF